MTSNDDIGEGNESLRLEFGAAIIMEQIVRSAYADKHSSAIQPLQWSILRYLNSADLADSDITTIAKHVGLTNAPVSRAIDALERRKLVTRVAHPTSKRSIAIRVETEGLDKLQSDPILKVAKMVKNLPKDERAFFARVLGKLALEIL